MMVEVLSGDLSLTKTPAACRKDLSARCPVSRGLPLQSGTLVHPTYPKHDN
jgi:hypothetical protein